MISHRQRHSSLNTNVQKVAWAKNWGSLVTDVMFPNWNCTLIAVSVSFHGVAILSTVFRLCYRWYTARMWWDDAWAVPAFLADIAFLIVSLLEQPIPFDSLPRFFTVGNWIISFAYPTLMWSARISILASIVRVSHPEGILRHIALAIGASFGIMALAMFALRIQLCVEYACYMTKTVLIAQTTTDCVADVLLSALPLWFLHSVKLSRTRRVLISSVLSASMVINVVTIIEAVALFQSHLTSGSIIFEHVKVACSMIVCNLLVIVTFVYRILHKGEMGIEDSISETNKIEFTTVDLALGGFSQETSRGESCYGLETIKSSTWSFEGGSGPEASGSTCRGVSSVSGRCSEGCREGE